MKLNLCFLGRMLVWGRGGTRGGRSVWDISVPPPRNLVLTLKLL